MKKLYFLFITLLFSTIAFSQGLEDFTNSSLTTSYADNSFVGNNGITWTYVQSRDANGDANGSGISLPALMLRRIASDSKITSSTIPGGIQDFSVKLYKGFTGGGNRQVELFINGVSQGVSEPFDDYDEHLFEITNLNIAGDVVIEIRNITAKQVIIDDISWTGFSTNCNVTLGQPTYICQSNTVGDDNDSVIVEIPYTGSDASITGVTASIGTVGGDNPATTADGTITISGVTEGQTWSLTLNGGDCEGLYTSATVPSDHCDPAPSTCFDLSTGSELFEIVTLETNSSNNSSWTESSGTYSINGYCGGGCQEPVEGWLIFGPLDMTGVSQLELAFTATKSFTETPLEFAYTTAYPGCPSEASWTSLQTLTASGDYEIDLASMSGTEVFIGVQYVDDGTDGFSGWVLSNVMLQNYSTTCPTLGTRPTSDCNICELAFGEPIATCDSGSDKYTVEVPFDGGGTATYTFTINAGEISTASDNPDTTASGTVTFINIPQGTDLVISYSGGFCSNTMTVNSPYCVTCPEVGSIIITEIMQNPSVVNDGDGEWFEVYNTTSDPIDLHGWTIQDDTSTTEKFTVDSELIVPANGYKVFGINGDTSTNGGVNVDYTYTILGLSNGSDGIQLICSETVIDMVVYDNGATFPDPNGASMELDIAFYDATANDLGAHWTTSTTTYGGGDKGTPGAANTFDTSSIDNIAIDGFVLYPNPVNHTINIVTRANAEKQVQIFDMLGKQVVNQSVSGQQLSIDIPTGIYIIKVEENGKTATQKLIVN